ncbi:hypothetical protein MHK_004250, partial [Candidatus Magnetomorum sp. HK-1]
NIAITADEKNYVQAKINKITGKKPENAITTNSLEEIRKSLNTNSKSVKTKNIENLITDINNQFQKTLRKHKFVTDKSLQIVALARIMIDKKRKDLAKSLVVQFIASGIYEKIDCKSECEETKKDLLKIMRSN